MVKLFTYSFQLKVAHHVYIISNKYKFSILKNITKVFFYRLSSKYGSYP